MKIKNILLATDFSKHSLNAEYYTIERAESENAKIHLLHVIQKSAPILAIRTLDLTEEKINESIMEEAEKKLERIVSDMKTKTSAEIIPVIRKGIAYEEIVKYSNENNIDLIVISTSGKLGFLKKLQGSVAEKVYHSAKCPVLVITPDEEFFLKPG